MPVPTLHSRRDLHLSPRRLFLTLVTALALLFVETMPSQAEDAASKTLETDFAIALVRTTIAAIDAANQTGDYSVLHALGASAFREAVSVDDLARQNAPLRAANIHLVSALLPIPEFTQPLIIDAENRLTIAGYVPTLPLRTRFVFRFIWEADTWRLTDIAVAAAPPPLQKPRAKPTRQPRAEGTRNPNVPRPTTNW